MGADGHVRRLRPRDGHDAAEARRCALAFNARRDLRRRTCSSCRTAASTWSTSRTATRPDRDAVLKQLREIALGHGGRRRGALPRAEPRRRRRRAHARRRRTPAGGSPATRTGDLFVTHVAGGAFNEPQPADRQPRRPADERQHVRRRLGRPAQVRQQALAGDGAGRAFDDTLLNPGQAQNVDVAPTRHGAARPARRRRTARAAC